MYWILKEEQTGTKPQDEDSPKIELPVLCEEDGKEVLWFSEIFGDNRPYYWLQLGIGAGRQKRHTPRGIYLLLSSDEEYH